MRMGRLAHGDGRGRPCRPQSRAVLVRRFEPHEDAVQLMVERNPVSGSKEIDHEHDP
jgi:hypothetical protein